MQFGICGGRIPYSDSERIADADANGVGNTNTHGNTDTEWFTHTYPHTYGNADRGHADARADASAGFAGSRDNLADDRIIGSGRDIGAVGDFSANPVVILRLRSG
ncbi:MAG: hypothetical protein A2784_01405 [Candidatus Chisholmbacteria bacterium RIFCSPHIGHO2_01_FULL_48_12]|uniref:Uncharacterized protein n=1 Tax=Candidatus Chisholmbacteria bacterium RIFCSPHIGHO2_01_FULL_48_12 TaxID=1797589 RepID=A0A1G1VQ70_9BACT|nr:MAG: hypothetical protein A2784_01405 [Candidatus Chisholmbacteria bacterium RIFCSPHIGHO2_01_FULL_48_12]